MSAFMDEAPLGTPGDPSGPSVLGFLACAAVVRRDAFLTCGGLDPVVFVMSEEARVALDLRTAGCGLAYGDDVVVHHPGADPFGRAAKRLLAVRNRALTAWMRRPVRVASLETKAVLAAARADGTPRRGVPRGGAGAGAAAGSSCAGCRAPKPAAPSRRTSSGSSRRSPRPNKSFAWHRDSRAAHPTWAKRRRPCPTSSQRSPRPNNLCVAPPRPGSPPHVSETSATFIGTATVLLRLGRFTVLTDPNFLHKGQRAYLGHGLWSRRRTEPALDIDELPDLDGIVLSHLHGDHFDRVARHRLPHDVPVATTRPAARRLRRWRFDGAVGLADWDEAVWYRENETLRVTAVPARHGPTGVHLAMPATMGSILDWARDGERLLRLYITGDTRYSPRVLRGIPERYGDIDAALVHLGGTRILGVLLTMNARDGLALSQLVRPRRIVPIHYDDYPVFREPLSAFLRLAAVSDLADAVHPITRGQTIDLLAPTISRTPQ
jgi:L-ascorbate metabolism protein UlaG (beta-lactamase superfamily)